MDYKKDFPIFNNRNITYLDSGATTQKPQYVIDAIDEFYEHNNANPHSCLLYTSPSPRDSWATRMK